MRHAPCVAACRGTKKDNAILPRAFAKDVLPFVGGRPIREVDDIELLQLLHDV